MSQEASTTRVEYRIKEKPRYIVTRYESTVGDERGSGSLCEVGQFDNPDAAYAVGYAMAKHDHEKLGYPPADERIQYPRHPRAIGSIGS